MSTGGGALALGLAPTGGEPQGSIAARRCCSCHATASVAKVYIKDQGAPIVVKADSLAAGKGVIVAMTLEEAYEAVDSMLVKNTFGSAGCRVIIEEYLEGEEAYFFALVDGENAIPLESAQDHKRVDDGDTAKYWWNEGVLTSSSLDKRDYSCHVTTQYEF